MYTSNENNINYKELNTLFYSILIKANNIQIFYIIYIVYTDLLFYRLIGKTLRTMLIM